MKLVRSPAVLMAIGVAATLVLALVVVTTLLRTGGAKAVSDNAALIGALVALGGVFTAQLVSIALDDRRSQEARRLEAQRASEAALQRYFKDVGELLIEKPLREASPGDNLSTVVRAQTLAVLEGLDHYRKRILLRFLHESGLIQKDKPVVSLLAANLHGAHLRGADLRGADLSLVNLNFANPRVADLNMVNQTLANPGGTARRVADLLVADLLVADLTGADLTEADLTGADLTEVNFSYSDLRGASLRHAALVSALFNGVDLRDADLRSAELAYAAFNGAQLAGARLDDARFSRTVVARCPDLHQATGLDSIVHTSPSALDLETLRRSGGLLPAEFLRGAGIEPADLVGPAGPSGRA